MRRWKQCFGRCDCCLFLSSHIDSSLLSERIIRLFFFFYFFFVRVFVLLFARVWNAEAACVCPYGQRHRVLSTYQSCPCSWMDKPHRFRQYIRQRLEFCYLLFNVRKYVASRFYVCCCCFFFCYRRAHRACIDWLRTAPQSKLAMTTISLGREMHAQGVRLCDAKIPGKQQTNRWPILGGCSQRQSNWKCH